MRKRIAILASGTGSNMENILKRIQSKELDCECALVFSDRPGAPCLDKARQFDVSVVSFSPKAFYDKPAFEHRLIETMES